jgi:hypothetical protein
VIFGREPGGWRMFVEEWKAKQAMHLGPSRRIHRIAVDPVVNEAAAPTVA